jgi:hypothetical protein
MDHPNGKTSCAGRGVRNDCVPGELGTFGSLIRISRRCGRLGASTCLVEGLFYAQNLQTALIMGGRGASLVCGRAGADLQKSLRAK